MRVSTRIKDGLLLLTAWLFAIAYTYTNIFPDPDLWGRLSMGALFFQNGRFPYHDVFSYTAPHARWIDHEWLTGLVFYQILTRFGEAGFLIFKYLMMLGIFALLFRLHRKVYRVSTLYAFYALFALVDIYSVGLYATVRSHIFTFLFLLLELYWLERVRLGQKPKMSLWPIIPLLVLWGNLHGGVAMGILLLGCYGLGEVILQRSLKPGLIYGGLALGSFLLLGFLNPYGPEYLSFLWHAWTLDRAKIGEWSALKLEEWAFLGAQLLFVVGLILLLLRWQFRDKNEQQELKRLLTPTLVMVWSIVMMLRAVRMQPFAAFIAIAYLPVFCNPEFVRHILPEKLRQFFQKKQFTFCTLIPSLLLLMAFGSIISLQSTLGLLKVPLADEWSTTGQVVTRYPIGATDYLKQSPYHGNLMVHFGLGEFTLWKLYPQFKVSMDGRYEEVYNQAIFLRNHQFYNKRNYTQNWNALPLIDQSQADFLLMQNDLPVTGRLALSPNWIELYTDGYFTVFGRKTTLAHFSAYQPKSGILNVKLISIDDMITDADLKRFKTKEY